ncbi:hypothetical protein AKJ09_03434 [Labilithrix luteola]|uniref:Outer membrane protein beta-barrel domain-containing protein n=1 Tax=Labilithrix luteola TaxID=1391654 RepID=A0A0K1PTA9_9BACT|nr:hypothetical protein AKJ09_03434 [Labilithrix luteola]
MLVASLALLSPTLASADPQMSAALTTGLAFTDLRADNAPRYAYHLGGRFDVLLLRQGPRDMALGPYVDVATEAFDTFQAGGGLEWLVPAGATAFIFSGGGFGRTSRFGWQPGVEATIFWGSRSYNYHSTYGLGVGLFAQGRYGFGDGKQTDAIVGVQVDLAYFALPFVFLYEAVRH